MHPKRAKRDRRAERPRGALRAIGSMVVLPIRLLLAARILCTSMEETPSFFSPDDPRRLKYRVPALDLNGLGADAQSLLTG